MNPVLFYQYEPCTRLDPVQEERLRDAILETERAVILRDDISSGFVRIIDAWITTLPPAGHTYLANAAVLRRSFLPIRTRARKRRVWWLPWRRGGRG